MRRLIGVLSIVVMLAASCGTGPPPTAQPAGPASTAAPGGPSTPEVRSSGVVDDAPGGSAPAAADGTTEPSRYFVEIYFVRDGRHASPVTVDVAGGPAVATAAIEALIAGPAPGQATDGLTSAVPVDTRLLSLDIDRGLARIDFSVEFEAGEGRSSMTTRLAQVVYTLTRFPTVTRVEFLIGGRPVESFSSEGLELAGPVTADDYLTQLPLTPTPTDRIELWHQPDLPAVGPLDVRRVVLLAPDDALNIRLAPGVDNPVLGMLAPGTEVNATGATADVEGTTWWEVVTPRGAGWASGHYLAEPIDDGVFLADYRVITLLDELASLMAERRDLTAVVSARGVYVSHHADPVLFTPDRLAGLLRDPTTYKWPSNAIDMDDPVAVADEVPDRTFAEEIGDSFASTWDDPDWTYAVDRPISGGNGRPAEDAIPDLLAGFHYISVLDAGDDPDLGGMDWTSWHVSIDYEGGRPVVVGLTLDQWAP